MEHTITKNEERKEAMCVSCGTYFSEGDEVMKDKYCEVFTCKGKCWDIYVQDVTPPDDLDGDVVVGAVGIEAYAHWNEDAAYMYWMEEGRF